MVKLPTGAIPAVQKKRAPLLLAPPMSRAVAEHRETREPPDTCQPHSLVVHVQALSPVGRSQAQRSDIVQEQRDGLVRLREKLSIVIRDLEAENASLRRRLSRHQQYPPPELMEAELEEARHLQRDRGIIFHRMPDDVYPGRPYVTQQDLIRGGITRYSRQNISRLARDEQAVPVMEIADRVLFPPGGVRTLLERERVAAADVSPRRRPGRAPMPSEPPD